MRLSIVISAVGDRCDLEDTLVSVLSHRPTDCEVLVACPGAYDDPYDLGDEVRFIEIDERASRIELTNGGIDASRGEVIHLLDAGLEVVEGWTELPIRWIQRDRSVAAVSPLVVARDDPRRTVAAGVRYHCRGRRHVTGADGCVADIAYYRGQIDGPTISAGFYRRAALTATGGFDPRMGSQLADVDWVMRLYESGGRCIFEPNCPLIGSADMFRDGGGGFRQGRCAELLFWRHLAHEGPWRSLLLHPLEVVADGLRQVPRPAAITGLIGRAVAWCEVACGKHSGLVAMAEQGSWDSASPELECGQGRTDLREAG